MEMSLKRLQLNSSLYEIQQKKVMQIISKDKNDVAKLVTNTDTYKIKRFDYPNSYFLNEQVGDNFLVEATTKSVYQLEKVASQKDLLYNFLYTHQIKEQVFDGDLTSSRLSQYRFKIIDLMNDFFISRNNLLEFCNEINAIQIKNSIVFLETEIFLKIFRELLSQLSDPQLIGLSFECITLENMMEIFPEISNEILLSVLYQFAKQQNDLTSNELKFALTYEKLYLTKKEYYMDEFIDFVDRMIAVYVPEQLQSSLTEQEKLIIRSKLKNKFFLCYDTNNYQFSQGIDIRKVTLVGYNQYNQTFEPKDRVASLFDKKKNFYSNEFRDYLEVLNLQKKEQDDLVLNSCRAITISIHKKNYEFFTNLYPSEHLNQDKLNPDNFSCKVYNYKKI